MVDKQTEDLINRVLFDEDIKITDRAVANMPTYAQVPPSAKAPSAKAPSVAASSKAKSVKSAGRMSQGSRRSQTVMLKAKKEPLTKA